MPLSITSMTMSLPSRCALTTIFPRSPSLPCLACRGGLGGGGTAPIASVAFLTILVSACEISRRSKRAGITSAGKSTSKSMSGWATRMRKTAWRTVSATSSSVMTGFGMRAKRELVDHALDVVDLAHDGIGTLVEHCVIRGDHFAVFAAQPLRRQLDRRQRILDFVGDAAGDVGPCRGALRQHQLGDVVDGDDIAVLGVRRLFAGHEHREITFLAVARHRDLALHQPLIAIAGGLKNLRELGSDFGERPAERFAFGAPDQALRRAVED